MLTSTVAIRGIARKFIPTMKYDVEVPFMPASNVNEVKVLASFPGPREGGEKGPGTRLRLYQLPSCMEVTEPLLLRGILDMGWR